MSVISLLSSDTPNTDSPANVDAAVGIKLLSRLDPELFTLSQKEIRSDPQGQLSIDFATTGTEP